MVSGKAVETYTVYVLIYDHAKKKDSDGSLGGLVP